MIKTLYKVPIWVTDNSLEESKLSDLEVACKKYAEQIPDYHHKYNPDTYKISRNTQTNLQELPEFDEISSYILDNARSMMAEMGYSKNQTSKLKLDNAWFCMYRPGDSVQMHIHRPSFISAAFYIKNVTDCKLRFIHDMYKMSPYPADINNEWSRNSVDMDCPPNRLILFPSDCAHGTDQIKAGNLPTTAVAKIMLSYNFVLEY